MGMFKAMRKNAELKQAYVAYKLNVTQATVSRWERGEIIPEINKIPQLARLYEKSIEEIVLALCAMEVANAS